MKSDPYKNQVARATAAVRHLGGAVRGSRAFFIYRDRTDASQPSVIACHPPLSDEDMLACLGGGHVVWASVSDGDGHHARLGLATDTTFENKELAGELTLLAAQSLSRRASLQLSAMGPTVLPDRSAFMQQLDLALHGMPGSRNDHIAVIVVDVDHFHRVISRFGEAGGDDLMSILGSRIKQCLLPGTVFAHLGGDRVAVMITVDRGENAHDFAFETAADIQAVLNAAARVADEEIVVTASIGVALGGDDILATTLLHDADQAIAMAKRAGGATTRVFRAGMNNETAFQMLRERDVRVAVGRGEFVPYYQPIVDVATGQLRSFEALLRWRNPEEGTLPPSTFLDVLEETGLIEIVGRRVIRESCGHAARWMSINGSLVPVAVNVAPVQLEAPDFCDYVARCLAETNLPPAGLILELTESALIADKTNTQRALGRLRELGVRVRIDDFGTGYSALAYLHELPVNGIKLDRSWFRRIEDSRQLRETVRAIVSLAHLMDMDVVAEGIETIAQLETARELGCDFAQGFWFSAALDAEHATRYIMGGERKARTSQARVA
jgi:diguanylate cyclase (GGDEF)-like protein